MSLTTATDYLTDAQDAELAFAQETSSQDAIYYLESNIYQHITLPWDDEGDMDIQFIAQTIEDYLDDARAIECQYLIEELEGTKTDLEKIADRLDVPL